MLNSSASEKNTSSSERSLSQNCSSSSGRPSSFQSLNRQDVRHLVFPVNGAHRQPADLAFGIGSVRER